MDNEYDSEKNCKKYTGSGRAMDEAFWNAHQGCKNRDITIKALTAEVERLKASVAREITLRQQKDDELNELEREGLYGEHPTPPKSVMWVRDNFVVDEDGKTCKDDNGAPIPIWPGEHNFYKSKGIEVRVWEEPAKVEDEWVLRVDKVNDYYYGRHNDYRPSDGGTTYSKTVEETIGKMIKITKWENLCNDLLPTTPVFGVRRLREGEMSRHDIPRSDWFGAFRDGRLLLDENEHPIVSLTDKGVVLLVLDMLHPELPAVTLADLSAAGDSNE